MDLIVVLNVMSMTDQSVSVAAFQKNYQSNKQNGVLNLFSKFLSNKSNNP